MRTNLLKVLDDFLGGATYFVPQKPRQLMEPVHHPVVTDFVQTHGFFSRERPLVGRVTSSETDIHCATEFLKKLPSIILDADRLQFAVGEILSKIIAYRDLKVGMHIDSYTVDHVFDLWNGMPAFGCVADNGSCFLLFRGSDFNLTKRRAWATLWSDLDPKGPGYTVYQKARPALRQWLKGKKACVMGCSLGGALAAYTALFDGDLLSSSNPSSSYNPPGVFRKQAKLWQNLHPKPPLITYVTTGDFIPKWGHLIGEVREVSAPRRLKPIEAHVRLMFAEP